MNSARYDWLRIRIGGPKPTIEGNWPALVAAMAVVFISFFAIGRTSHGGGAALHSESAGTVQVAAVKAEIPGELTGGPPIEGVVRSAIASVAKRARPKAQPVSTRANLQAAAPTQSLTAEAPGSSTTSESESSSAPAPATPTPAPAPTSSSEPRFSSRSPAKPTTRAPAKPSSGGAAFDSSE